MKKISSRLSRGFTLIELLVVIAIIGILATLLLIQLNTARSKGRDTQRVTAVSQLEVAVEQYFDDNGTYPAVLTDLTTGGSTKYIRNGTLPTDPSSGLSYGYATTVAPRTKYQIWAELENGVADKGNLQGDSDLPGNVAPFVGGVNGATEACTTAASDCIFDTGSN